MCFTVSRYTGYLLSYTEISELLYLVALLLSKVNLVLATQSQGWASEKAPMGKPTLSLIPSFPTFFFIQGVLRGFPTCFFEKKINTKEGSRVTG